jgi:hydroxymethylpyrimidine pyrophosphatase-like HAD family hydrolase
MIYIYLIILKIKINIYSWLNKVNLPLTNKKLIDKKQVRHVYKIEKKDFKAFYCMINGKSYILKYNKDLEKWFNTSEIEIKKSKIIYKAKNIASINNLKEFKKFTSK